MQNANTYWLVLHPDISRPIGGVKQMHRLAESISRLGRRAVIIQSDSSFHPSWFHSNVETISHDEWSTIRISLDPNHNVLVFPETYLPVVSSYSKDLPFVIFNQNSSYSFGLNSPYFPDYSIVFDLYNSSALKHVLCVSQYDYEFIINVLGVSPDRVSLVVNPLEDSIFSVSSIKKTRTITYMPRKNADHSEIVLAWLRHSPLFNGWNINALSNLSHDEVISSMRSSLIFLSFGHPEGFGLPVAEAMACGCAVVGYSGLGGRELFEIGSSIQCSFEVSFGDYNGFVRSLIEVRNRLEAEPHLFFSKLSEISAIIRSRYSLSRLDKSVEIALHSIESSI